MKKYGWFCVFFFVASWTAFAVPLVGTTSPDGFFQQYPLEDAPLTGTATNEAPVTYMLVGYESFSLSVLLQSTPTEESGNTSSLWLPMPDGSYREFNIWQQPAMDPATVAANPDILSLAGRAADDSSVGVAISYSPYGFNALVDLNGKAWFIDRHPNGTPSFSIAYEAGTTRRNDVCLCEHHQAKEPTEADKATPRPENCIGSGLRKYDLAVAMSEATTTQFANQTAALAHINTLVGRLNLIYQRDLAVRFELVSGLNTIYDAALNPEPNNYPHEAGGGPGTTDLDNSHANITASIGGTAWDIGFSLTALSTGGGSGLAGGRVCGGFRGRQVSAFGNHNNGVTDGYLALIAHEIGHQFGAAHTFTGADVNCNVLNYGGAPAAVEVGSGSTIMSYAGICGTDNLISNEDLYFHGISLSQMNNTIASTGCEITCPVTNAIPTVTATDCVVPLMTPFELTATASDPDGDPLTYTWEQIDVAPRHPITQLDDGVIPLFRSYPPITSPTRSFPSLPNVISGTLPLGEKWPTVPRTLNFLSTVRDGRGGTCSFEVEVEVTSLGPLTISSPSLSEVVRCTQTVTWNPNNTDQAPLLATTVNILLSTDGGTSYTPLAQGVPNNGSAAVTFPNVTAADAHIRIEPVNGCWYEISERFDIEPCPDAKLFYTGTSLIDDTCGNGNSNENGVIDPGESGFFAFIELSATTSTVTSVNGSLVPTTPGVTVTSGPQSWPTLLPGAPAFNNAGFTFSVPSTHPCGAPVDFTLSLNTSQGTCDVPVSLPTGRPVTNLFSYSSFAGDPRVVVPAFGNASATLNVAGLQGTITDVDLIIDGQTCNPALNDLNNGITYIAPELVDLTLISPSATSVIVQNGQPARSAFGGTASSGSGNICNTIFDDESFGPVAPMVYGPTSYQNTTFQPHNPLSAFDGETGNGNWQLNLRVPFNFSSEQSIQAFSLQILTTVCDPPKEVADLAVTKRGPTTVEVGATFPYTIAVTNLGPATANNVILSDTLPAGLTPAVVGPFNVGTLLPGTGTSVTFNVTVTGPARVVQNCAGATSDDIDPVPGNNTNCVDTSITDASGDLSLTVSGVQNGICNATIVYNLLVSNLSNFVAENTVITSTVPAECFTATAMSAACVETTPGTFVCTIPTISVGATEDLLIQGTVGGCCLSITNESVLTQSSDINPANNADSHAVAINPDNQAPTFGTPVDFNLGCNPTAGDFPDPTVFLATANDNCGVLSATFAQVDVIDPCANEIRYDYIAEDACGNVGTASFRVFWTQDTALPTFAANPPASLDLGCNPAPADFPDIAAILASATDNCGITNTMASAVTNGGPCAFSATYTYTAVDRCNQTGTDVTQVNWIEDTDIPVFTDCSPASINLGCNPLPADFPDPAIVLASATDACGIANSWVEGVRTTNGCDITMVQTFYAVDACNQTGTCQRTIAWTDSTGSPSFTGAPPATLDLGCNPSAADFPDVAAVLATATDDCGIASSSFSATTNAGPCAFSITYTWTAVDTCGVTGTAITVANWIEDMTAPSFGDCSPSSINIGCNPLPEDFPDPQLVLDSATDNCGVVTSWVEGVRTTNGCDITMVQTFYTVDACNQTGTCQRIVMWTDSTGLPSFTGAPPATLDLGCNPSAADFPDVAAVLATATDDCGIASSSFSATTNAGPCAFSITYTWTAVDTCGVTGTTVTVASWIEDTVAPEFVFCEPASINLGCNPLPGDFPDPALVLASADDNCGVVTSWVEAVRSTNGCDITMVQTFTTVDACNQTGTCQRTIMWTDSMGAPSFPNAPPDTLDLGCNPLPSAFPDFDAILASATDDCGIVNRSFTAVTNGGPCARSATYTWTAEDTCGVIGTAVTVANWIEDTETPVFPSCANVVLGCNPAPSDFPDPALVLASATDNCGIATSFVQSVMSTNGCTITMLQSFTAIDACGLTETCNRTIEWIIDSGPPTFTVQPPNVVNIGCNPAPGDFPDFEAVRQSATDDCGVVTSSFSVITNSIGGGGCGRSFFTTWVATDGCGQTTRISSTTVWTEDNEPPMFPTCTTNVVNLGCNPSGFPNISQLLLTATDNCRVPATFSEIILTTNGCTVTLVANLFAVDECNMTGTCQRVFQWTADPDPVVACDPDANLGCNPAIIPPPNAMPVELCQGTVTPVPVTTITASGCIMTRESVFTVTNVCGDLTSCTQTTIWVEDDTPPILDCSDQEIVLESGTTPPILPVPFAQDDCGVTVSTVTNVLATNVLGDIEFDVVYRAIDCTGAEDQCLVTVRYRLPGGPMFDCLPDMDLGCNGTVPPSSMAFASLTSNCPIAVTNVIDNIAASGCERVLTRIATATDVCGDSSVCTQIIRWVVDLDPPELSCTDLDLGCNPASIPTPNVIATDACGGEATTRVDVATTIVGCDHLETRVFTATDPCGNTTTCTQLVQWIEDVTPPQFEGCPEAPVFVFPGQPIIPPVVTANDDCGVISLTAATNALSTNANGDVDTEIVYSARDCAGKEAICQVILTYDPASLPPTVIPCQGATQMGCDTDFSTVPTPRAILASIESPCGIADVDVAISTRITECGSMLTRLYTVIDGCGRTTTCTEEFVNTASDTSPPLLIVPPDFAGCGGETAPTATGMATANDRCSNADITFTDERSDNGCTILITRTWTATDACGNTATGTQQISLVNDATPPELSCPISVPVPVGATFAVVPDLMDLVTVNDACGDVMISQRPAAGTILAASMPATITVTDGCGNQSECQVQVLLASASEATVGNEVWEDLNADGLRDPNEPPIAGLTVELVDASGAVVDSTTTDINGLYLFVVDFAANRQAGGEKGNAEMFSVGFSDPMFRATVDGGDSALVPGSTRTTPFALAPGDSNLDQDLGLVRGMSISGVVWNDLNNDGDPGNENLDMLGVNGIPVQLFLVENGVPTLVDSTTSAAAGGQNGAFSFTDLEAGDYQLRIDTSMLPANAQLTPEDGILAVTLAAGQNIGPSDLQSNFGFTPDPAAAELTALEASGDTVRWTTGVERETLGFELVNEAGTTVPTR